MVSDATSEPSGAAPDACIGMHALGCMHWDACIGMHALGCMHWDACIGMHALGCSHWDQAGDGWMGWSGLGGRDDGQGDGGQGDDGQGDGGCGMSATRRWWEPAQPEKISFNLGSGRMASTRGDFARKLMMGGATWQQVTP